MAVFARPDETIRVPKLPTGPHRVLPRQFARRQHRRWPWFVAGGLVVAVLVLALAVPRHPARGPERTREATELLRLLRD